MKKFLNNLKQEADGIVLSSTERHRMRLALRDAMAASKPGSARPTKSPYPMGSSRLSFGSRAFGAACAALLVTGIGTASAAQGSLPGDLLYPVKLSINESVESALATTPTAKAQLHVALAQRRVEEAEALAAQGNLGTDVTAELEANFEAHVAAADTEADNLQGEDPGAAAEVKAQIVSSLAAHGAILAKLGESSINSSTKENSGSLAGKVLARAERGKNSARAAAFAKAESGRNGKGSAHQTISLSATDPTEDTARSVAPSAPLAVDQKVAAQLQHKAVEALADARKEFASKDELDAAMVAKVTVQLKDEDLLMAQGSAQLGAGDYAGAQEAFTQALELAVKIDAVIKAQKKFEGSFILPLLNYKGGADDLRATSTSEAHL